MSSSTWLPNHRLADSGDEIPAVTSAGHTATVTVRRHLAIRYTPWPSHHQRNQTPYSMPHPRGRLPQTAPQLQALLQEMHRSPTRKHLTQAQAGHTLSPNARKLYPANKRHRATERTHACLRPRLGTRLPTGSQYRAHEIDGPVATSCLREGGRMLPAISLGTPNSPCSSTTIWGGTTLPAPTLVGPKED